MRSEWKKFWKEIKLSTSGFVDFAGSHKGIIIVLAIFLMFLYGQKLFYFDLSIDSEVAIASQGELFYQWIAIDRFGLIVTKALFGFTRFVPEASVFMMVLALGFTAFYFDFCVYEWKGKDDSYKLFYYIFPMAYVSAPCLAEQFNFTLQAFEVAFAGLLCLASVYFISIWIFKKGSVFWLLFGFIMTVWSFASYHAFLGLFIFFSVVSFIFLYQNTEVVVKNTISYFFNALKYIIVFIVSFAVYELAARAVQAIFNVEPSAYLESKNIWTSVGVDAAIGNISSSFNRMFFGGWETFFSKLFFPVLIVTVLLLIFRGYKARKKGFFVYIIAVAIFAVSPMLLDIVTGSMLPIRAQLVYPLVYAFCLALITTIHIKPVSYIWCISAAIISLHQGQIMTQLFMVSHMTYEYDKATAVSICDDINEVSTEEGLDRFPVVFVGSKRPNLPSIYPKGDVIGYSFFEWDQDWYYGSTRRIIDLCRTLGYDNMIPPSEEIAAVGNEAAKDMPVWPVAGSVKEVDGIIVVRLS